MPNSIENISVISIQPKEKVADVRLRFQGQRRELWVTSPDSKWKSEMEGDPETGIDENHPLRALIVSPFPRRNSAEKVIENTLSKMTDEQIEAYLEPEDEDESDFSQHPTPHAA